MECILDTDIVEKRVVIDSEDNQSRLHDSYDACIVFLMMNLSATYMELRHYSEAVSCLNEAESLCGSKIPDVLLRRSQARTYNKSSSDEDLLLALADIKKALEVKQDPIYEEHLGILNQIIANRQSFTANLLKSE